MAPGSTFKPLVALAGLESGAIDENTAFNCGGGGTFYGHFSGCWAVHGPGVALHKGMVGRANFVFNLVYLSLVLFLCGSGIVMWWKRRPVGQLAAPLYPRDFRLTLGVGLIALILGVLFPLGGAVIVAFAIVDFFLPKRLKQAGMA